MTPTFSIVIALLVVFDIVMMSPTVHADKPPTPATPKPTKSRPNKGPALGPTKDDNEVEEDDDVEPTASPTKSPTKRPKITTPVPTSFPTITPTKAPTLLPTLAPTLSSPTPLPTNQPTTLTPTSFPTLSPTTRPTLSPTNSPTLLPTNLPTLPPTTLFPTDLPTNLPTTFPTFPPTNLPSLPPTNLPTLPPTNLPTRFPTVPPTPPPTLPPTTPPTLLPTANNGPLCTAYDTCPEARALLPGTNTTADATCTLISGNPALWTVPSCGSIGGVPLPFPTPGNWFSFTATTTACIATVTSEPIGALFFPAISVFSGECSALQCIEPILDTFYEDVLISWQTTLQTKYSILVRPFDGAVLPTYPYTLTLTC